MDEYTIALIEEYCMKHRDEASGQYVWELLEMAKEGRGVPEDWETIKLTHIAYWEEEPELKEALDKLDDYLFGGSRD